MADEETLRSYLKKATARLHEVSQERDALAASATEPIAVVGMGCRFPGGVRSPQDLWDVVDGEREVLGGFPSDRGWNAGGFMDPANSSVRTGGFVDDVGSFDAAFFGINPREALAMDPQQRVLLEVAWEALEDAQVVPKSLRDSDVGVFVGIFADSYGDYTTDADGVAGYRITGMNCSVASGRIAYVLGLRGPAISVDTACSSALVALHQAVLSLRAGECGMALAGGVTVMSTPQVFTEFSRLQGLARDGRCKAFAAAADGTGFAEGAGVLLLERLSDAQRHGHQVLAVVRGSAINQDGASNGLSAPNGPAQQRAIRRALAAAGLSAGDVDVVEAHGTGTTLGDPIEAQALLATYGQGRPADRPLWLGSVKSNLGHSQAASGMASVIKMVMALRHGRLPKTLHVDAPSPHVDWSRGAVRLLTEAREWAPGERPRRAGLNSFGISGTNAHVILEEAAVDEPSEPALVGQPVGTAAIPWVVSARSGPGLRRQADKLSNFLSEAEEFDPVAVGLSLATTRSRFEHRAVVVGADRNQLRAGLAALAEGREHPSVVSGAERAQGRVAFIFPGQGAQWPRMGEQLLRESTVFAAKMSECAQALCGLVDWSLYDVLADPAGAALQRVEVLQPVSFAVMVSLAELWRSLGVVPDAVLGHSQGEIAAAHVAGVLSLPDAARIVVHRARVLTQLAGSGGMAAVSLPSAAVSDLLARRDGDLQIAAVNAPSSVVVAGNPSAIAEFVDECTATEVFARVLPVDYASHSAQMESVREDLLASLRDCTHHRAEVPIYSSVTGKVLDTAEIGPEYWYRNLRETVQFHSATQALLRSQFSTFIEVSTHPVLTVGIGETCEAAGPEPAAVISGTLRRDDGGLDRFLTSVAEVEVTGRPVDWTAVLPERHQAKVALPTYAFERERFWMQPDANDIDHPFLHAVAESADGGRSFDGRISLDEQPWLADHAVGDSVLLPGAAFVELALWCGRRIGRSRLRELNLHQPLVLVGDGAVELQIRVDPEHAVSIHSRVRQSDSGASSAPWRCHARGELEDAGTTEPAAAIPHWPPPGAEPIDLADVYPRLEGAGYHYGPAFRGLQRLWTAADGIYAEVQVDPEIAGLAGGFVLHPVLLDAAMQALVLPQQQGQPATTALVPFAFNDVVVHEGIGSLLRVRLQNTPSDGFTVTFADQNGNALGGIGSLVLRPLDLDRIADGAAEDLFRIEWAPVALPGSVAVPAVDVLHCAAGSDIEAVHRITGEILGELQRRLRDGDSQNKLAVVTQGAVARPGEDVINLAGAAVWGLVRTAQSEHPDRFLLIDTDPAEVLGPVRIAEIAASAEPQTVVRGGRVYAARLAQATGAADVPPADLTGATVLITGGTGTLGTLLAHHLVQKHEVARLVLTSRRGRSAPGADRLIEELSACGVPVSVVACDVSDRDAVAALLDGIGVDERLAVIHAAGVLDDGVLESLSPASLAGVLAPKADAALHLHELTSGRELSAFIMFSSLAGTFGNPGQSNYAAANALLDGIAAHRAATGRTGQSIAWGWWAQESALTKTLNGAGALRLSRSGLLPMPSEAALSLFDAAVRWGGANPIAARLDTTLGAAEHLPKLMRDLVAGPTTGQPVDAGAADPTEPSLAGRLASLQQESAHDLVLDLIRTNAATVLNHEDHAVIGAGQSFREMGFDSLTAVELRNRLNTATGMKLKQSVVFDYPTPSELAEYLLGSLTSDHTTDDRRIEALDRQLDIVSAELAALGSAQDVARAEKRLRQLLGECRLHRELGGVPDRG